jgi:hypothetical protein
MEDPISPARRTLLKAGAVTLATPVAAAIAQPAAAPGHQEAKTFDLWVISDQHVGTDKAASEGIQHGLVGFRPPPVRAESLATALRQSEEGGACRREALLQQRAQEPAAAHRREAGW